MTFEIFTIFTFVEGLWIMFPAYGANGLAPLVKFLKVRHPVDGNRTFHGQRLFGEGKSWEGLLLGTAVGAGVGLIEYLAFPYLPWSLSQELHGVTLTIVPMTPLLGALLGLGAMVGDLTKSFIKRRFGLARGRPAPLLDQDDFVLGSFAFASLLVPIQIAWVILFLIITPAIHWFTCFLGWKLKIKKEPW